MSLESYLRRILSEYSPYPPKLIVKDTHMASDRRNLLQYYFNQSVNLAELTTARDLVIVHTDPAARPFLDQPESGRPEGFRDWRKFGGPPDAPGQSMHHPAVKEHEFIAWLLTMHFLSALEILAVADTMDNAEASVFLWNQCHAFDNEVAVAARKGQRLPKPLYDSTTFRDEPWTSLLFGEETFLTRSDSVSTDNYWKMNRVQCRTSFEPIVSGDLSDMVVSGSIGEDVDIMLPKSNMFYNSGWVLDLSDSEKKAKRSLNRFGGLGFVDRKKAYYGIVSSGTIRFFLTHSADNSPVDSSQPLVGDNALLWFKSVVICEVNEQRSANACNTEKDVLFTVGGVNATDVTMLDAAGTKFLGKRLCVYLAVPETAVLTSHADLAASTDKLLRAPKLHTIGDEVGMVVTATVQSKHIYRREEACSISHLVWEQHPSKDLDVKYLRSNERM